MKKHKRGFLSSSGLYAFEWEVASDYTNKDARKHFLDLLFSISNGDKGVEIIFSYDPKESVKSLKMAKKLRDELNNFIKAVENATH